MTKMPFTGDNDVVKALSSDRSDKALREPFFRAIELKSGDPVC